MERVIKVIRRTRVSFLIAGVLFLLLICGSTAWAQDLGKLETERTDGGYFTMLDEKGKKIHCTAVILNKGDEFISADNFRYRITDIEGDIARTRLVGKEKDVKLPASGFLSVVKSRIFLAGNQSGNGIAIYHTHSDESYIPTDGTESIYGNGGIFKVGTTFAEKLQSLGFNVDHSKRFHDPHDINAYYRSRRTAAQLLQKGPHALFDVHRDAVPPEVYSANVNGQEITKVKLVLGRTNPHFDANFDFAKLIKAAVDKTNPGVIQGILIAQSDFNQDLAPHSLLLEVGAHTNSREAAERGISLFAEAIPQVLGVTSGVPVSPARENRGSWRALLWGLLLAGGAVVGYLFINTGSLSESWNQIRDFLSRVKLKNK
jgi:stage II sporulation protein P